MLRDEPGVFPPLAIKVLDAREPVSVRCSWEGRSWRFLAVPLKLVTPKRLAAALATAAQGTTESLPPMVLTEHLKERDVGRIAEAGVSGIDLCGNGIVQVPGELLVRRVGQPCADRRGQAGGGAAIRNVYRGTSGLVARTFLLTPSVDTNAAVRAAVQDRGGSVSPGTVSKVLGTLEEDLVIVRDNGGGRLVDADELVRRLQENYQPPNVVRTQAFCYRTGRNASALASAAERAKVRLVLDGRTSAATNATRAASDAPRFYCTDLRRLEKAAGDVVEPVDRYADLFVEETDDPAVYFDARDQAGAGSGGGGPPLASPLQVWLELSAGDAREREAAEQVLRRVLDNVLEAGR
ncbi:MAG: hypothetical protein AAF656_00235 [Planctomycetota bacterium]